MRKQEKCKLISLFSPIGGTGQTSVACKIGMNLVKKKKKVCLLSLNNYSDDILEQLDLKSDKDLSIWEKDIQNNEFNIDENYLYEDIVEKYVVVHNSGLCVLPNIDCYKLRDTLKISTLNIIIDTLEKHFDYLIIDFGTLVNDVLITTLNKSFKIIIFGENEHINPFFQSKTFLKSIKYECTFDYKNVLYIRNNKNPVLRDKQSQIISDYLCDTIKNDNVIKALI